MAGRDNCEAFDECEVAARHAVAGEHLTVQPLSARRDIEAGGV
jgi:hypothetical protein